ncbi:MAG: hypothetical protein RR234_10565 [Christensenella sp.]
MANEKNLIAIRSTARARELGAKGGKAAAENNRKRKALKESMNTLLNLPISNTRDYNKIAQMGIQAEDIDNSQLIVLALFNKARGGDVPAIKELRALIDEDGASKDIGQLEALIKGLRDE